MNRQQQFCMSFGRYYPDTMLQEFIDIERNYHSKIWQEILGTLVESSFDFAKGDLEKLISIHGESGLFEALNYFSREIHEHKHYLDLCGTPFGRNAQLSSLNLVIGLIKAINDSNSVDIYLPVKDWVNKPNCPGPFKDWVKNLEETDILYRVLYGNFEILETNHKETKICYRKISIGDHTTELACVPISNDHLYVLGAGLLIEGIAFLQQVFYIESFFGGDFGAEIADWFYDEAFRRGKDGFWPYIMLNIINRALIRSDDQLIDYTFANYSIMTYPEVPFIGYLEILNKNYPIEWKKGDEYPDSLFQRIKKEMLDINFLLKICDKYIDEANKRLTEALQSETKGYNIVVQQRINIESTFLEICSLRKSNPDTFLEPNQALKSFKDFPKAKVLIYRSKINQDESIFELPIRDAIKNKG